MLDLEEWALVLSKMLRFHFNISEDIKKIVQTIRVEMKPELIPFAEEKSNFGKVVKKAPPVCAQLHPQQADCQAGGGEEALRRPDQGPGGNEGYTPGQASGS